MFYGRLEDKSSTEEEDLVSEVSEGSLKTISELLVILN